MSERITTTPVRTKASNAPSIVATRKGPEVTTVTGSYDRFRAELRADTVDADRSRLRELYLRMSPLDQAKARMLLNFQVFQAEASIMRQATDAHRGPSKDYGRVSQLLQRLDYIRTMPESVTGGRLSMFSGAPDPGKIETGRPAPPDPGNIETGTPAAPDLESPGAGRHYAIDPDTGRISRVEGGLRAAIWTREDQERHDRGWHYAVDPDTGNVVQRNNLQTALWTREHQERMDRGWHYGVDPDSGRITRINNVRPAVGAPTQAP